jgi:hypothetical protein
MVRGTFAKAFCFLFNFLAVHEQGDFSFSLGECVDKPDSMFYF